MTADMRAKLTVNADASAIVGELRRAVAELDKLEKSVAEAGRATTATAAKEAEATKQVTDTVVDHGRAVTDAKKPLDDLSKSVDQHVSSARALADSYETLRQLEEMHTKSQIELERAMADGIITADEAATAVAYLDTQFQAASEAAADLAGPLDDLGKGGGDIASNFASVTYQISDFIGAADGAVVSSNGLAGALLKSLGTAALGLATGAIGAAVTAAMALGSGFLTAADRAADLDKANRELDRTMTRLGETLAILRDTKLDQRFGSVASEVRALAAAMSDLDRAAQLKSLQAGLDAAFSKALEPSVAQKIAHGGPMFTDFAANRRDDHIRADNWRSMGAQIDYEDFDLRRGAIMAHAKDGDTKAVLVQLKQLLDEIRGDGAITDLNADLIEMLGNLRDTAVSVAEFQADVGGSAQAAQQLAKWSEMVGGAWADIGQKKAEAARLAADIEVGLSRQLELARAEAAFGAESAEVQALKTQYAREELDERMAIAGVSEEERDRLLAIYDATADVTAQSAAWADTMSEVGAELRGILSLISSIGGVAISNAATRTRVEALRAGASVADAAKAEAEFRAGLEHRAALMGARTPAERFQVEEAERLRVENNELTEAAIARDRANRAASGAVRGGSGGGSRRTGGADREGRDQKRLVSEIEREIAKLDPSYERAAAAAAKWRDEALSALDKTKAGYADFATDVETIYQDRLKKAYEDDLKRRDDWAAGVERALKQIEDRSMSWADFSEDLVSGIAGGMEKAWTDMAKNGMAGIDDLVDHTLDALLKMAYQLAVQPMLNQLFGAAAGMFGIGGDPLGAALRAAGAPAISVPTAHTGDRGVMRSYSSGNRMRPDEKLAMLRDGEKVWTPRQMENAGAIVSLLSDMASRSQEAAQVGGAPVINVVNNSSAQMDARVEEEVGPRGQRQFRLVMDDAVSSAIGVSGGRTQKTMRDRFGLRPAGVVR